MLLFYSIIFVPVKVSFYDESSNSMLIWDFIVDGSFGLDIVFTFFTGIERKDHSIETDLNLIAKDYLKLWFWIDLMSTMPVGIFELNFFQEYLARTSGTNSNNPRFIKLLRLARLPRLYRILRIFRIFKMMSFIRNNSTIKKFNEFLRLSPGITTIFTVIAGVFYLSHLVACFWFLVAKITDFPDDCWVRRQQLDWEANFGSDPNYISEDYSTDQVGLWYSMSVYWTVQTLLTVGFGDINGKNVQERVFVICWIVFAVSFYSYSVGNVTSVISSMDDQTQALNEQIATLHGLK